LRGAVRQHENGDGRTERQKRLHGFVLEVIKSWWPSNSLSIFHWDLDQLDEYTETDSRGIEWMSHFATSIRALHRYFEDHAVWELAYRDVSVFAFPQLVVWTDTQFSQAGIKVGDETAGPFGIHFVLMSPYRFDLLLCLRLDDHLMQLHPWLGLPAACGSIPLLNGPCSFH
jgi:hypothetical protein